MIESVKHGKIVLVINTPTKGNDSKREGFRIRRTAVESSVGIITSLDTAAALADVLEKDIKVEDLKVYRI
jgi:carbamoyl-phosphate synthase large subunit